MLMQAQNWHPMGFTLSRNDSVLAYVEFQIYGIWSQEVQCGHFSGYSCIGTALRRFEVLQRAAFIVKNQKHLRLSNFIGCWDRNEV